MKTLTQDCAAALLEAVPAAMRVIRQQMRRHRVAGLSVPQLRVLAFLDRDGPATLSEVAEHVGTTLPSLSRMVQALVAGQMVRRRAGAPDRRTVCLSLAAKGRRVLEIARRATVRQLAGRIGTLRTGDIVRLQSAMKLLLRLVAADSGPGGPREKGSRC